MDLGRYQRGDGLPLLVTCRGGDGLPVLPDAAPTATIAGPDGDPVASLALPLAGSGTATFAADYFLGILFTSLGTYQVTYRYDFAEGAGHGSAVDSFEVIAGGDDGGAVVAMSSIDRPEASYVVAQVASGKLVQGRNPRLQ